MSNDQTPMRPWYQIHGATLGVVAVVVGWFVFVNIPGDRLSVISNRYSHGWPYHYFERQGPDRSFWTFAGPSPQFSAGPLILNALTAFCVAALAALACELWIRRNGRLFRFGLRSVFLLTTAVAVLMGLVVREVHQCHRQNQALRELAQLGRVTTKRDLRKYDWFRSLLGRDYDGAITRVEVDAPQPTNGPLPDLSSLQQIKFMELDNIALTPGDVEQLASLPKLHDISVSMSDFRSGDAAGLRALTAFPKLYKLHFGGGSITDEVLEHVSRDSQIQWLNVAGTTQITSQGLRRLSESTAVLYLWLDNESLQKHDFSILSTIPNLHLAVFDNTLTAKDEEHLRSFFPNAKVETGLTVDTREKFISIKRIRQHDRIVDRALPH